MPGRGYEYMTMHADAEPDDDWAASASHQSAGPFGFAGTANQASAPRAAGLTTLADGSFGGGPTLPMVPGSWRPGNEER